MYFKKHRLYHVFNQGNNRDLIFFNDRNYRYFIEKIKQYILPYADILAWCLLPNHFHLMIYVRDIELPLTQGLTRSQPLSSPRSQPLSSHVTRFARDPFREALQSPNNSCRQFVVRLSVRATNVWGQLHSVYRVPTQTTV